MLIVLCLSKLGIMFSFPNNYDDSGLSVVLVLDAAQMFAVLRYVDTRAVIHRRC